MTAPRRRWSFTVRTLLVVVTAVAIGIAFGLPWHCRQRQIQWVIDRIGAVYDPCIVDCELGGKPLSSTDSILSDLVSIRRIILWADTTERDAARIGLLFPEAKIEKSAANRPPNYVRGLTD